MPQPFRNPVSDDEVDKDWTPPDYAKPAEVDKDWKPPSYVKAVDSGDKTDEKPSVFKKIWDKVSEPLTDIPTKIGNKIGEAIDQPSLNRSPNAARLRGFLAGATEAGGRFVSGLTSPLNLGLTAAGVGEEIPAISNAARTARRVLSIPIAAEGAKDVYQGVKNKDFSKTVSGAIEAGLGAAGTISGVPSSEEPQETPTEELPIRQQRDLSFKPLTDTTPQQDTEEPSIKQPFVNPFEKPQANPEDFTVGRTQNAAVENIQQAFRDGKLNKDDALDQIQKALKPPTEDLTKEQKVNRIIGEAKTELWKPPDYAQPVEEPLAARTSEGKLAIGADIKSLGKVLGTSLYKGDIAPIATKELLQNSIDAVRHLGSKGQIKVLFNHPDKIINVTDNGKGLTRQELESVFTDLGASGKREDASAAGGFGLAKAAPLLGGKKVEVSSVSQDAKGILHQHLFTGTPDELLEGVDIKHAIMPPGTPTGTSVKVHVPEESNFYGATEFVKRLARNSPDVKGDIKLGEKYYSDSTITDEQRYKSLPKGANNPIITLESPSATTTLSEPIYSTRKTSSSMNVHLSNNGMYQGTKPRYFNGEVPNIPSDIIVDIKSKVPEGHSDYPFTANREELRGSVEDQVNKYIDENIVKPSVGKRVDELKRLYNTMPEITVGKGEFPNTFGRKVSIYDPKGQISQSEMKEITSNPAFHTLANNMGSILDEAMKTMGKETWTDRLEKFGVIFDDKLHGIHIPNPGSGKSAILINPFIAIGKMSPDEASANILHTILHEMAHIEPDERAGHNESFTIRLGDIYARFGARRSVEAQDSILNSIANKNTGIYNPEIQKILSTYKESRGREATTEDLLSGTGIGSRPKGGGKGAIPPSNKSDEEGTVTTKSALDKLFNSMGQTMENRVQQDIINKGERAKRFAAFAGVKAEGMKGAKQSLSALKGEFEKVDPEQLLLKPKEADSLFTAVKRANITEGEKARGYTALFKLLNGEQLPQRNELKILDDVFGNGFADRVIQMHGGIGAVGMNIAKVANTMKSMQNSISLAAPLRHGIGLIARKEFYPAFSDMFKFFAQPEFYKSSMQALEDRPNYMLGRESGLFLSKPNSLQSSEEEFLNSYIGKVPVVRDVVGASQRAYTGFLNKLRADTFDSMIKKAKDLGYDVSVGDSDEPSKETRAISNFINNATGRGSLGSLNKVTNELNTLLWSPRMIASRITMLTNPSIYTSLPKGMRMEGIKSLLGIAALGTAIDTLSAYGGAKVSTNILSSDFGKSRFGTKLIDPWGGFQQYIVGAARFLAGKTDSKTPTSRLDIAGRFLANKESPAASLAHTLLTAKKFTGSGNFTTQYGEKTSVSGEVAKRFTPIFIQDVQDLAKSQPDFSEDVGLNTILTGASLAGMSQEYAEPKPKGSLGIRKLQ